jgi:signal transduction histidine kinase
MMNKLWFRLSLAFLLVAWFGILVMGLLVQRAADLGFTAYIGRREGPGVSQAVIERLQAYYAEQGTWQGADSLLIGREESGGRGGGGRPVARGALLLVVGSDGTVQAASEPERLAAPIETEALASALPLQVTGQTVGWLVSQPAGAHLMGEAEIAFLTELNRSLVLAALIASAIAILMGPALAWVLARPLRSLTSAVRAVAAGSTGALVQARGTDELRTLADAYNHMVRSLSDAETLRQRMSSDIAHELRTPVTVLRGHLEAMMDGVFPLDNAHLAVAYDQSLHLARLVDDLRLLTQAEARRLPLHRSPTAPEALVTQALERFSPLAQDADIRLRSQVTPPLPPLEVDSTRLLQVFDNLLTNALRHCTPGGEIVITAQLLDRRVEFSVSNSGHLSPDVRAHIFERFWRADESRQRDSGGTGLGLAISRELVRLHGGDMRADSDQVRTRFLFWLPGDRP